MEYAWIWDAKRRAFRKSPCRSAYGPRKSSNDGKTVKQRWFDKLSPEQREANKRLMHFRQKLWRANNPSRAKAFSAGYYQNHREELTEKHRARRRALRDKRRAVEIMAAMRAINTMTEQQNQTAK